MVVIYWWHLYLESDKSSKLKLCNLIKLFSTFFCHSLEFTFDVKSLLRSTLKCFASEAVTNLLGTVESLHTTYYIHVSLGGMSSPSTSWHVGQLQLHQIRALALSPTIPRSTETSPRLVRERVGRMWIKLWEFFNHSTPLFHDLCIDWWQGKWGVVWCHHWGNCSNVPCPEGRYVTLRARESWKAMSSAASSLRNSTRPSPASIRELAMSKAAWESPSAEMMAACFCCSA